jgi:hypothetical protein
MDGAAKAAVHMGDWKFTTLLREVGLAMMPKKISSPFAGNVIAGFIRTDRIHWAWNWVTPDPAHDVVGALVWRKYWVKDMLYSPASYDHCQAFYKPHSVHFERRQAQCLAQFELSIAQYLKWETEPISHLTLIFSRLRAEAEHGDVELQ